ncbi:MAG TPA: hypothetical protein DCE41_20035 [Cytophagales bacterium]|nr:hypothetical protein [Cytophagales bacterium]HAA22458.1 hypothetical protein [Cytophagales bacterium]HAP58453.1 hypothetical protein [Cytophagales bacterium]
MKKHLSLTALILACLFILFKLWLDVSLYQLMQKLITQEEGDISPQVLTGTALVLLPYLVAPLVILIVSIVGYRRQNRFRKPALWLSILGLLYGLVPVGMLLALP